MEKVGKSMEKVGKSMEKVGKSMCLEPVITFVITKNSVASEDKTNDSEPETYCTKK